MPRTLTQPGTVGRGDKPNWLPLECLIGFRLADWFMWMYDIELADGTPVHAYKHIATRCYCHLGEDGRAFAYTRSGQYRQVPLSEAIDGVFDGWEYLLPQPEDPGQTRADLERALALAAPPE